MKNWKVYNKKIITHTVVWVIYILFEISVSLFINPSLIDWRELGVAFTVNVVLFYLGAYYVFPQSDKPNFKSWVVAITKLLAVVTLYVLISYAIYLWIYPIIHIEQTFNNIKFDKIFIAQHLWRGMWFTGLSLGYWFARKSIKAEQLLRRLEREQYLKEIKQEKLEKEIVVSQLLALKNQINPHFLFNTLNFFYSSIWPLSKTLAASLQKLSDIMRYSIKHTDPDGLADLPTEIEQVNNYIDLNQLRYPGKLFVDFRIIGIAEQKKILAAAMMTLVENAFKYGDLTDPENPLIINLNVQFQTFEFNIRNKKNDTKGLERNGVGLINLKKRLQLVYSDTYSIDIQEDKTMFNCRLKINMADG
jgi:two-component system LytT family sensor kinase